MCKKGAAEFDLFIGLEELFLDADKKFEVKNRQLENIRTKVLGNVV